MTAKFSKSRFPAFKGVLNKPVRLPPPRRADRKIVNYFAIPEWSEDEIAEYLHAELDARWLAVEKHYGIREHGNWKKIACALAYEFVPGFQVNYDKAPARGRKRIWNDAVQFELVWAVRKKREARLPARYSARSACAALAKEDPWKSLLGSGPAGGKADAATASLYARYQEATKSLFVALADGYLEGRELSDVQREGILSSYLQRAQLRAARTK